MAAKTYQGLNYRSVQQKNTLSRTKLPKIQQVWLKDNHYKNVGWEAVIQLCEKIAELLEQVELEEFSLEELFLEADRIGNKYQTPEEVSQFQEAMAVEANEIADSVDRQFPQTEAEVIDFSRSVPAAKSRKGSQSGPVKRYQTRSV
jgi:hypothetical protein